MPYSLSAKQHHAHKCRRCSTVWHHDPLVLLRKWFPHADDVDRAAIGTAYDMHREFHDAYDLAHKCPTCGKDERSTYDGECRATYHHTGLLTELADDQS